MPISKTQLRLSSTFPGCYLAPYSTLQESQKRMCNPAKVYGMRTRVVVAGVGAEVDMGVAGAGVTREHLLQAPTAC